MSGRRGGRRIFWQHRAVKASTEGKDWLNVASRIQKKSLMCQKKLPKTRVKLKLWLQQQHMYVPCSYPAYRQGFGWSAASISSGCLEIFLFCCFLPLGFSLWLCLGVWLLVNPRCPNWPELKNSNQCYKPDSDIWLFLRPCHHTFSPLCIDFLAFWLAPFSSSLCVSDFFYLFFFPSPEILTWAFLAAPLLSRNEGGR